MDAHAVALHRADGEVFLREGPDLWRLGQGAPFCITPAGEPTTVVGAIGLFPVLEGTGKVGYWVAADRRRAGVAGRALRLACGWGFSAGGLARIEAEVIAGNTASMRTLESVGFQREGVLRHSVLQRGLRHDGVMFSLLPGELRV